MNIYNMLVSRALNGNSGGGDGNSDAYTATVTFAVQDENWIGAMVYLDYVLDNSLRVVDFENSGPILILSKNPMIKLPLLKDKDNYWSIKGIEFYAPDGETQLQGNLHFIGDISPDGDILGDCTITLNVDGQ